LRTAELIGLNDTDDTENDKNNEAELVWYAPKLLNNQKGPAQTHSAPRAEHTLRVNQVAISKERERYRERKRKKEKKGGKKLLLGLCRI